MAREVRRALVHVIEAGIDSGELPPHLDPELAAMALIGPILYRRLLTPEPLLADQAPRLLEQVLGPRP